MIQDMLPPPPLSLSPNVNNKSESPVSSTVFPTPTHDYNTTSTIKYCGSNGLDIHPVQPAQHAYVIQQCHSSEGNRSNEQVRNHEDQNMDTHQSMHHHHPQSVLSSTANHGSSGGQLDYVGVPQHQDEHHRKKDTASPISSAGSRSPSGDQQSPPDTTKKSTNNTRRPEKPNLSYINMIAMAIKESPDRMLTLNGIYNYLQQK